MYEHETIERDVELPELTAEVDARALEVYCWRMEQLLRAGYDRLLADALAEDTSVDLHRACELLTGGCDTLTASRILL